MTTIMIFKISFLFSAVAVAGITTWFLNGPKPMSLSLMWCAMGYVAAAAGLAIDMILTHP